MILTAGSPGIAEAWVSDVRARARAVAKALYVRAGGHSAPSQAAPHAPMARGRLSASRGESLPHGELQPHGQLQTAHGALHLGDGQLQPQFVESYGNRELSF